MKPLNESNKLVTKLLTVLRKVPTFKEFFSRNSLIGQLFPCQQATVHPKLYKSYRPVPVQQQLIQQLGAAGGNSIDSQQYLHQQVQQAQSRLNQIMDKVNKLGGSSSDMEIHDFKPNSQHTKTFWNRIEYGCNIQLQRTSGWLPVTSDVAITVGYKLNDKSVIGIGTGYKMGWGKNLSNIRISSRV